MVNMASFTPRALISLSNTLVHDPPGRLLALSGPPRHPVAEFVAQIADIDELLGVRAPSQWHGLGVVLDGSSQPGDPRVASMTGRRLRVAYLLDRQGHEAITVIVDETGSVITSGDATAGGYVADLCHRILGLDCDAEHRPVSEWVMAQWLTRLLDIAADPTTSREATNWAKVARLHPAFDPALPSTVDELAAATIDTVRELPWPSLRRQVTDTTLYLEALSPDLAAWMDDAFFARFLIEGCRTIEDLLDDLRLFLDDETLDAVALTVAATLDPWRHDASWPRSHRVVE